VDARANQEPIEELWRSALSEYREEGLKGRLKAKWPYDPNVTERITYDFPPTFQPGYVGKRYFEGRHRIVLLGKNPGRGTDPEAKEKNRAYRADLESFARGEIGFEDANHSIASHVAWWRIYAGKGVLREGGADRVSLIAEDVRPSIQDIAHLNFFPFKSVEDADPLDSPFREHVWRTYVQRMLELLRPTVIVRYSSSDSVASALRRLPGSPKVFRVLSPAARSSYAQRVESWEKVSEHLRGS
jgi:hypothetical protein